MTRPAYDPAKLTQFSSDPLTIVAIIIGRSVSKIFAIYKEFACYYSPVLRAAFNGPFLEGQSQTMIIDDFSLSGAFGFVLNWMYTGRLHKDERLCSHSLATVESGSSPTDS